MTKGLITGKCEFCGDNAICIIRTRNSCKKCYEQVLRDNKRKHDNGIEILNSIKITKKCSRYKCPIIIESEVEYVRINSEKKLPRATYCSKECKNQEEGRKEKRKKWLFE